MIVRMTAIVAALFFVVIATSAFVFPAHKTRCHSHLLPNPYPPQAGIVSMHSVCRR